MVGCLCLWNTTLATAPDGEPYRVHGPMYTPSISAQYHEHVYGKYAKSQAGITEHEAYFEVMSVTGSVYRAVCLGDKALHRDDEEEKPCCCVNRVSRDPGGLAGGPYQGLWEPGHL